MMPEVIKTAPGCHELPDILTEADNHIRNDVSHDDIKPALYLLR